MSKARKTFSPFEITEQVAKSISKPRLAIGNSYCDIGEKFACDQIDEAIDTLEIEWAKDSQSLSDLKANLHKGLEDSGLYPNNFLLLVIGMNRYLGQNQVLYSIELEKLSELPQRSKLHEFSTSLLYPAHMDNIISVKILQAKNIENPLPLLPYRKGHCIAENKFTLQSESPGTQFIPQPLDDKMREKLGLKNGTIRFLQLRSDVTAQLEEEIIPTLWVDKDILEARSKSRSPAGWEYFETETYLHVISTITADFSKKADTPPYDYPTLHDTLIGRLISILAGNNATDLEKTKLLKIAIEEPNKIVSLFEDDVSLGHMINR